VKASADYYKISDFIYYELNEETLVVMHNKGIVKIKENRMKNSIKEWDKNLHREISKNKISEIFGEDSEAALNFMLDNHILEINREVNFDLNKIRILTNSNVVAELIENTIIKDMRVPSTIATIDESSHLDIENDALYVVFLNPYNKQLAAMIDSQIKKNKNSILLMSYVYNNNFYMDSFYFPPLYNPCHMCHMGHIESQLRINTDGNITYQHIIDSIYLEEPNFSVNTVLTQNNMINIVALLGNKMNKFITLDHGNLIFPEEWHECTMFDLQTNKIHTDFSLHWELCDCYEG
jgi:McbB family protein